MLVLSTASRDQGLSIDGVLEGQLTSKGHGGDYVVDIFRMLTAGVVS